jgi:ABC-type dipeptide/oligopeptide/nickel transport system ATPase component
MVDANPTIDLSTTNGDQIDTNTSNGIDYTDKQVVRNLQLSLENIVNVSEAAFAKISHLKEKELLLAFGNTGCGKSTMISSLVFGPDKLEMKAVPEKKMVRGVEKTYYNKIIDQKEDFKEWLTQ